MEVRMLSGRHVELLAGSQTSTEGLDDCATSLSTRSPKRSLRSRRSGRGPSRIFPAEPRSGVGAAPGDWTTLTRRSTSRANGRPKVEHRLVVVPATPLRHHVLGGRPTLHSGDRHPERSASDHASHVGVVDRDVLFEGEGPDRRCGVGADPREGEEVGLDPWHDAIVGSDHHLRTAEQPHGSGVVAEATPPLDDSCLTECHDCLWSTEELQNLVESIGHPLGLRLLEQDLSHQDDPRFAGLPPRESSEPRPHRSVDCPPECSEASRRRFSRRRGNGAVGGHRDARRGPCDGRSTPRRHLG